MTETKRRPRWLWIECCAVAALLLVGLALGPGRAPTVRWQVGGDPAPREPFADVAPETPLELEIELPEPMHVYVASVDPVRGSIAMFPSSRLTGGPGANPLGAGQNRLPGAHGSTRLEWHTGIGVGAVTFLVVASRVPIPALDAALPTFRQMGNAAFPGRSRLGTYAPAGGMASVPTFTEVHTEVLRACHVLQDPTGDGPMRPWAGHDGIWLKALRLNTPPAEPADEAELDTRIRERLGELDGAFESLVPATGSDRAVDPAPPGGR